MKTHAGAGINFGLDRLALPADFLDLLLLLADLETPFVISTSIASLSAAGGGGGGGAMSICMGSKGDSIGDGGRMLGGSVGGGNTDERR